MGGRRAILSRLLLAAVAGMLLSGSTCDDNLGDIKPGAVAFRASVGPGNLQAIGGSTWASCSRDGRYVAFQSSAKNIANPSSAFTEIFVRDRLLDQVRNATRLSVLGQLSDIYLSDCTQPYISPNGSYLVFLSKGVLHQSIDTTTMPTPPVQPRVQDTANIYFFDLTQPLDLGADNWFTPLTFDRWPDAEIKNISVSDDGKVAFETGANNIPRTGFPDFVTAGVSQVFVWDTFAGAGNGITLISRATGGTPGDVANGISEHPRISGDGQFVVFASRANNLTADPTNARRQIYLSASDGSSIKLVSRATGAAGATSDEHCARPCLNVDGTVVAFQVQNNIVGPGTLIPGVAGQLVVRRNVLTEVTDLIGTDPFLLSFGSPAEGLPMAISDDGEFATWLRVGTDASIVVRDMIRGRDIVASFTLVPASGTVLELPFSTISGDGIWVFWSSETEFQVLGDTNNAGDIFGFGPMR
jgi:hypothetical protein